MQNPKYVPLVLDAPDRFGSSNCRRWHDGWAPILSLFFAHVLRVLNASNHHRRFLRAPAWWVTGDRSLGTLSWWVLLAVGGGSGVSPLFRWRLGALSCLVSNYSAVNVNVSGSFVLVGTSRNKNARAVQSCFSRRHKCLEHRNCIKLMSQNHEP